MKALDLFCGAGGASEGLNRAGFLVSGVDIKPQKRYPFFFMEADAMTTDLAPAGAMYDFIWASPPCQAYSRAQRIQDNDHPEYIPELRKRLKATGLPYVIENVEGAPLIDPIVLCGAMFGLKVYRHRLFECSFPVAQPPHPEHLEPLTKMGRPVLNGNFMHVVGNFSGVQRARDSMGIQWMTRDELREAIPPAYSQYLAEQFLGGKVMNDKDPFMFQQFKNSFFDHSDPSREPTEYDWLKGWGNLWRDAICAERDRCSQAQREVK